MKEIIFALPPSTENTAELYDYYKKSNCKIKIYDYPSFQTAGKKRQLREFEIEDLLFRKPISYDEVEQKLSVLKNAVNSKNNDLAREALRFVIPTFKSPEEVNKNAEESMEMNIVKTI